MAIARSPLGQGFGGGSKLGVTKSEKSAIIRCRAGVAELVDALDLGSSVFGREGSSPFTRIVYAQITLKTLFECCVPVACPDDCSMTIIGVVLWGIPRKAKGVE